MSNWTRHPYHLVDESPWPLIAAFSALGITSGLVIWFHQNNSNLLLISLFSLTLICYQWWRDIHREATLIGHHSYLVELGLRSGIILFITSEVFFFLRFFWSFFHRRLASNVEIGRVWPPAGVLPFNTFEVPLINTLILLSSGIRVTWAHHSLIQGLHNNSVKAIWVTIILGAYFTLVQAIEYIEARFTFADSIYGSVFFIATGFHGIHVIIGTVFLSVSLWRITSSALRNKHHFGFEAAAWYWHFVDVVWLFLFITIYWWSGA